MEIYMKKCILSSNSQQQKGRDGRGQERETQTASGHEIVKLSVGTVDIYRKHINRKGNGKDVGQSENS